MIFAGVMMLLIGFLNFFYGLAAVTNDSVVVVGGHRGDHRRPHHLGLGDDDPRRRPGVHRRRAVDRRRVARWVGVFLVMLNAIGQVWIFPAAPLWAFIVILLDVIILYNLTARWSGTSAV